LCDAPEGDDGGGGRGPMLLHRWSPLLWRHTDRWISIVLDCRPSDQYYVTGEPRQVSTYQGHVHVEDQHEGEANDDAAPLGGALGAW
jgi:hypothetical protein